MLKEANLDASLLSKLNETNRELLELTKLATKVMEGGWFPVCFDHGIYKVHLRWIWFSIPYKYMLYVKGKVYLRIQISENSIEHPHVYCKKATRNDPAIRFAVYILGKEGQVNWLKTNGYKKVNAVNSIIDWLTGVPKEESRKLPVDRPEKSEKKIRA
jgi:hypothetical protein